MPVEEGHIPIWEEGNYCLCDAAMMLVYPYGETVEALAGLTGEQNGAIVEEGLKSMFYVDDNDEPIMAISTGDRIESGALMAVVSGLLTAWLHQKDMSVCRAIHLQSEWLRNAIKVDAGTILEAVDE